MTNHAFGIGAYVTIKDSNATFTPDVSERRGTTTTFSHSGLKNADAQSGVSQAVNATQQYDAFGNLASSTGTWQGQFGYGGGFGYQQDATGLKLLGHRYYDASTGRFLTRDPIKDGRNWYVYCAGDPIAGADPTGLILPLLIVVAAGALLGAAGGAWVDEEDRWRGAGRGALLGATAALVGALTGGAATAGAGSLGLSGWGAGAGAGAIGGFAGGVATERVSVGLGWKSQVDWDSVAVSAIIGGVTGGFTFRSVPRTGSLQVTHWGDDSPWVQYGGSGKWNHKLAGKPKGLASTFIVQGSDLVSPSGFEWGKGVLGQRILRARE